MQGLHLVPRLTALENVALGALARPGSMPAWRSWLRWYPPALCKEASTALGELGLAHRLHARADQLSGGERQKVSLARLRLQQPKLILADEPTSALDPETVGEVLSVMQKLAQEGMTMVVVTHEMGFARKVADWVVVFESGAIIEQGPPSQIFDQPLTERTRDFLGHLGWNG